MGEAGTAEILELWEEREDVLDARRNGADPFRKAMGEDATNDLSERPRPARLGANEHAPVYTQVSNGGEEGGYGTEGRKAVAELDR